MSTKDKKLIALLIGLCLIWPIYMVLNKPDEPIAAAGMTEDERAENDSAVLYEELSSQVHVKSVKVDYDPQEIKVYLDIPRSEQYAKQTADEIEEAVETALEDRRGDLTIEGDFGINVYDKDEAIIF